MRASIFGYAGEQQYVTYPASTDIIGIVETSILLTPDCLNGLPVPTMISLSLYPSRELAA